MFNIDGELIPMSLAWRLAMRREYRRLRRAGYGPLTAHGAIIVLVRKLQGLSR